MKRTSRIWLGTIGLFVAVSFAPTTAALAQDGDPDVGASVWQGQGGCTECHGFAGHGIPENPLAPTGANLRSTSMNAVQVREIIACGRPGGEMPRFHRSAWSDRLPCFGLTADDVGEENLPEGGAFLNDRSIDAVVAFIFRDLVGAGPVTREECDAFFGAGQLRCDAFPPAAAQSAALEPAPAPEPEH